MRNLVDYPQGKTNMSYIRSFSHNQGFQPTMRTIDNAAPNPMRHELIGFFFHLLDDPQVLLKDERLYQIIRQSVGLSITADPYGGYRNAADTKIEQVDWRAIYDLIPRLWVEFKDIIPEEYREGINRILSTYGVVWELGEDGHLYRVLPTTAHAQIQAAIHELSAPKYAPALHLLQAAIDAYDDAPRRDRDACCNVFDALESVVKEINGLPNATFGQVVTVVESSGIYNQDTINLLRQINHTRNHHFGHGMTTAFTLSSAEVDFVYLTCIGAILLFARTP